MLAKTKNDKIKVVLIRREKNMNNFFGYKNKDDSFYGESYLDRKLSEKSMRLVEEKDQEVTDFNEKVKLPSWLSLVMSVCFVFPAMVFAAVLKNMDEKGFEGIWNQSSDIIIAGGISLVVALGIYIYSIVIRKRVVIKEEQQALKTDMEDVESQCKSELNVPVDAIDINVLISVDELKKNGDIKKTNYLPVMAAIFIEDDAICFAFIDEVYKIHKSSLVSIDKNKKITFVGWNKETEPKNNKYNDYKVVVQSGIFYTTMTYSLVVDDGFNKLAIIIPCYDIEPIANLLEMEINEESN